MTVPATNNGWTVERVSVTPIEGLPAHNQKVVIEVSATPEAMEGVQKVYPGFYVSDSDPVFAGLRAGRPRRFAPQEGQTTFTIEIPRAFLIWDRAYRLSFQIDRKVGGKWSFDFVAVEFVMARTLGHVPDALRPVVDLRVASEVVPHESEWSEEVTGLVDVEFEYDFGDEDEAWFRVGSGNVQYRYSLRRADSDGGPTVTVPVALTPGPQQVKVVATDIREGTIGTISTITVTNPHGA